jgi:hypothetical protein
VIGAKPADKIDVRRSEEADQQQLFVTPIRPRKRRAEQ